MAGLISVSLVDSESRRMVRSTVISEDDSEVDDAFGR